MGLQQVFWLSRFMSTYVPRHLETLLCLGSSIKTHASCAFQERISTLCVDVLETPGMCPNPNTLRPGPKVLLASNIKTLFLRQAEPCLTKGLGFTWTPKVCRIMAFWAIFRGFRPLFYLLWGLGFRSSLRQAEP